jgi:two-component system, response regulator YesN
MTPQGPKENNLMAYKVFLVEDEIVTRENIRDNVNWKADGFEFCGEAADGELALPLLRTAIPDVLITDIKMPFMDGLQLCKIVRESMPSVKVIILSGHDEFEYAQRAIQLGVTEYLLKPVSAQDLHQVLQKIAMQLDQEHAERRSAERLWGQIGASQAAIRERFLLKLVIGVVSSAEAFEQSKLLGLNLIARWYQIVVIRIVSCNPMEKFNYGKLERVQQIVTRWAEKNPEIFILKKDLEELVLIIKGDTQKSVEEEQNRILQPLDQQVIGTDCKLIIGRGFPKDRITDISRSFLEAILEVEEASRGNEPPHERGFEKTQLLKADRLAIEDFLNSGAKEDIDSFFDAIIQPLGESAVRSYIVKVYLFVDIFLTTTRFIYHLGGDPNQILPEFDDIEKLLASMKTLAEIKEQWEKILLCGLTFRDSHSTFPHINFVQQAKEYINKHFLEPGLSLSEVAAYVNHSLSHFSTVFNQETSQTFKEYITDIRIKKAKELLRTTNLTSSQIAYQIGYNDPHYFSFVFKKHTGLTPREFRSKPKLEN